MTDELLEAVAEIPKVMPHIEVPAQAGNDEVLKNMKREYTIADYRSLIEKIRATIPNVSIGTDIIVGFPGEHWEREAPPTIDELGARESRERLRATYPLRIAVELRQELLGSAASRARWGLPCPGFGAPIQNEGSPSGPCDFESRGDLLRRLRVPQDAPPPSIRAFQSLPIASPRS